MFHHSQALLRKGAIIPISCPALADCGIFSGRFPNLYRHLKKQWLYFLVAFALPTLGILTWWGLFSNAKIEIAERGPYRYAYLGAEGPYSKLVTKRGDVEGVLRQQGVELKRSITIIFDDPRTTPTDQRRARTAGGRSATIRGHQAEAVGRVFGGLPRRRRRR